MQRDRPLEGSGRLLELSRASVDLAERVVDRGLHDEVDPLDERDGLAHKGERLKVIPGKVPDPLDLPKGCRFSDRCKYAEYRCDNEEVQLRDVSAGHWIRCWKDIQGG